MKKKRLHILIAFSFLSIFSFNGCELEEANENPNDLTEVPSKVLLPYIESRIADLMGGQSQLVAGIYINYFNGTAGNYVTPNIYGFYYDHNRIIWDGYYQGPMMNARKMIDIAEKEENFYYAGIGKILMALCVGNLTSLYGDIPYSEALKSSEFPNPRYDNQQLIYETIQSLLDEGLSDFRKSKPGLKPGTDDIIFKGDTTKWIKAAYSLKARYYIHLTKRASGLSFNPAQKALEAVNNALNLSSGKSNDDLEYPFTFSETETNPFWALTTGSSFKIDPEFSDLLSSLMDPRRTFYYGKKYGLVDFTDTSYFSSKTSPVLMMTYHELKFIEAEARLRINATDPLAQTALQEAVSANISKVTKGKLAPSVISDYVNNQGVLTGTFDDKLRTIIIQKRIALFTSQEPWTDYRRTGYPTLTPNALGDNLLNPGGAIPRRFPYSQTETINQNMPKPIPTMQDRFWWDQD